MSSPPLVSGHWPPKYVVGQSHLVRCAGWDKHGTAILVGVTHQIVYCSCLSACEIANYLLHGTYTQLVPIKLLRTAYASSPSLSQWKVVSTGWSGGAKVNGCYFCGQCGRLTKVKLYHVYLAIIASLF